MRKKTARRTRRDRKQWTEIVRRFESSGLTVREFCAREDLVLSSFHRWQRQLCSAASGKFIELDPTTSIAAPSSWSLDVTLPDGSSLRFEG